MPAPRYTLALLMETVAASRGATLLEEYDACNATTTIRFKCKCGKEGSKKMRSLIDKGGLTCKKCAMANMVEKTKHTTIERYGVEHSSKIPEVKAKRDATMLERYGVLHTSQSPIIQQKIKESNIKKYGVSCTIHAPEIKEKVKATNLSKYGVEHSFQATEVKEKAKATLLERYGVEHASQMATHKEKVMATCMENYGVSYPMMSAEVKAKSSATSMLRYGTKSPKQNESVKKKTRDTVIAKYGVDHVMKVPEIKEKARISMLKVDKQQQRERTIATNLKKYGVPHTSQSEVVMEKIQRNSKKYKEFTMPSGAVRRVQGYEPFALTELLKAGYTEEQIKTDRADVPRISYEADGKQRVYFPDIWIPHENLIIEVKSTWTASCKTDNIGLKEAATKAAGFNYELWCYDGKGEKVSAAPR